MRLPLLFRYGLPLLGLAAGLTNCHSTAKEEARQEALATGQPTVGEASEADSAQATTVYPVVPVTQARPTSQLSLPGELLSYYETDVFPKVSGYVKKMYVDIGDRVRAGQVVADLEAPELQAQLADAFAQVKGAEGVLGVDRATYRRLLKAAQTPGAVSPQDLDVARGKVAGDSLTMVGAQARYRAAQEMIGYLKLRAPFSGVIAERQLAPGALVGPAEKVPTPLYRLKQEDHLRLQLSVPEKYVNDVRKGTPVQFTVNSLPGQVFRGRVDRLSYNVQRQIRSMLVEIDLPNPGNRLVPGMFAQVLIPVKRSRSSLAVPTTAVVTNMQGQFVVGVADGRARWINVQRGMESGGMTEVFGPLRPGEVVLQTGTDAVHDGDRVQTKLAKENSVDSVAVQ